MWANQGEAFPRIVLRRASGEGILTQVGREVGWESRVPEVMFSITAEKPVFIREKKVK